jgi:hypothetical protein
MAAATPPLERGHGVSVAGMLELGQREERA